MSEQPWKVLLWEHGYFEHTTPERPEPVYIRFASDGRQASVTTYQEIHLNNAHKDRSRFEALMQCKDAMAAMEPT